MIFEIVGTEIVAIGDEVNFVPIVTEIEVLLELGDNRGILIALEQDNEDDQEFDD